MAQTTVPIPNPRPERLPRRYKAQRPPNRLAPMLIIGSAIGAGLLMFLVIVGAVAVLLLTPERIAAGVEVAGLPLGSQPVENAESLLQQQFGDTTITTTDGDRQWPISLSELGVTVDLEATLQAAREAAAGTALQPVYHIDLTQAQNALVALSAQANIAALPGDPPQYGRAMEIPVMLDRLRLDAVGELSDGVFELNMIEVAPPETPPAVGLGG